MDGCRLEYIGVTHFDVDEFGDPSKYQPITSSDLKRLEGVYGRGKAANLFSELEEIRFMRNNLKKYEIECLYDETYAGAYDGFCFCEKFLLKKLQGLLAKRRANG